MNWVVFTLLSWVLLGCEMGLRDALQLGDSSIAPSFVMTLVVYVSLWARTGPALVGAMSVGMALDILTVWPTASGEGVVMVGPWTFGYMLAAYTGINFRTMMFRRSAITVAMLSVLASAVASVVGLALVMVRASYDDILIGTAASELWARLASAVYTGALALVIAPALQFVGPWLGMRRPMGPAGALRFS